MIQLFHSRDVLHQQLLLLFNKRRKFNLLNYLLGGLWRYTKLQLLYNGLEMKLNKKLLAALIIVFSVIALLQIGLSFSTNIQRAKYLNVDFSKEKKVTANELFNLIGKDTWKLNFLINHQEIITPIAGDEPKINIINNDMFLLGLYCGTFFTGNQLNESSSMNNLIFTNNDDVIFNLKTIGGPLVICPNNEAVKMGENIILPALSEKMSFYLVENHLILHSQEKQTSFVFEKKNN